MVVLTAGGFRTARRGSRPGADLSFVLLSCGSAGDDSRLYPGPFAGLGLFLFGGSCRLCRGGVRRGYAGKHGTGAVSALDKNRQAYGREHENDRCPSCYLSEQVSCTARTERGLGALAAEGSGEVGAFALLEEYDPNQDDANDNVNSTDQPNHTNLK
jgi:hypothetical protein